MTFSDAELQGWLEDALFTDPRLSAQRIDVFVRDGVVTLRGTVQSEESRTVASAIAGAHPGCRGVVDHLRVVPADDLPDHIVARNAREALDTLVETARKQVKVVASGGTVTLRGSVPSEWERAAAEDVVRGADGVWHVNNELAVTGTPGAFAASGRSL